ncbi:MULTISPECIES: MBL fold metallo-hydrolase [Paenibacillus]|uniref:MBL fold metallo-hydrolase n=1 Tax=Paenibacillus TaxID=44249 RepID=UPI0022B86E8A|nr:MBL fold metallo-hydrolase [Paenibacillus caseinilyticus]MCZ8519137.1 MBL fold metallo-hydrolase [Paenibacillus caseinilyticus]
MTEGLHTGGAAAPVTSHDGVLQVKVPLPFPLRWVNAYLVPGASGWTLIDPGLRTQAAETLWETVLAERGIAWGEIERIVLTHHHPDHYGLAGWFQERTGAPVFLSETGLAQARLLWGVDQPMTGMLMALFRRHGLPEELEEPMREHMDGFVPSVSPQPEVTVIRAGEPFRLGDELYETMETPGHAAGHLVFYRRESGTMFCGDHVLPQISPNVSYLPGGIDENPLASYLASLEQISRYEVRIAFPGHREPFAQVSRRAQELIAHHGDRLHTMRGLLGTGDTAYGVCRAAFGNRLTLHQLRFALAETLAHLIWLREAGQLEETERNGIVRFRSV